MQSSANGIFYMLNSKEESEEYSTWLSKLETLDHQKRSRVFFQNLKSKNRDYEFHGPIRNFEGKLSNSLTKCLKFGVIIVNNCIQKLANNHFTTFLFWTRNWILLSRMRNLKNLLCHSKIIKLQEAIF